jgi:hypothetical protein
LQTVNTELKLKLEAVSRGHSDLQNLMAATDFGILFLDAGLRIKRFTRQVSELISITPHDEGRPVTDFAHRLEYEDLVKDSQLVLTHLSPIMKEVRGPTGPLRTKSTALSLRSSTSPTARHGRTGKQRCSASLRIALRTLWRWCSRLLI